MKREREGIFMQSKHLEGLKNQGLLLMTVIIWGSLYAASRVVLQGMPTILLLFLRFSISSILLLLAAKVKKTGKIQREDRGELLFVGFFGYFLSNTALLLGVQYSNASFSSLINAMCPIFITVFAVFCLGEKITKKEALALLIATAGAAVIIGNPGGGMTGFGIFCCFFSLVTWSYTTIHIKKLTAKYDPILVTGSGMGIAAVLALPSAMIFMRVTGADITLSGSAWYLVPYICIICTAVSHLMWNLALSRTTASQCASWYPVQPLTSMLLGAVFLKEELTWNFAAGSVLILAAMILYAMPRAEKKAKKKGITAPF